MPDPFAHISELYRRSLAKEPLGADVLAPYIQGGRIVVPAGLRQKQQATFAWYAGDIARALGHNDLAAGAFAQLVVLEEALGEPPAGLANSYARLGGSLAAVGRMEEAWRAFAAGEAHLGDPPVPAPYFHYLAAFALSEAEEYGRAGPHWQRAYRQYRAEGDIEKAAKARLTMTHDLLQMARNTYARGDAAIQAGAAEAVLAELADQFYSMTMTAKRLVEEMLADPELLPHTAPARIFFHAELANAFIAMGHTEEATAQLKIVAEHPDTSEADRSFAREQIGALTAG